MLTIRDASSASRREFLRVGSLALGGLTLPGLPGPVRQVELVCHAPVPPIQPVPEQYS